MNLQELAKECPELVAAVIKLQARCDAIGLVVEMLSAQMGADPLKTSEAIERSTRQIYQQTLIALESSSPGIAASLARFGMDGPILFDE